MKETIEQIDCLLAPETVAVVGASSNPTKVGNIILAYLKASPAELFLVNPRETEIAGYRVYHDVSELPEGIDVAVITIGAQRAVEAAEECAKRGVRNIIVVAGGFGEIGEHGHQLEEQLRMLPATYGTRILGPNTVGVFVPASRFDTVFVEHGNKSLAGGGSVAFVSQSGSVGVEALGLASNTGFGLRAFVGIGNKIDLTELEFLEYFGQDDSTNCVAFYLESIESGRAFLEAARRIVPDKPVVVLKAGRTTAGASAVSSHTGRLAGSDKVVDGAFRQYGIQRVFDEEELCDAAKVVAAMPQGSGNRVAIITGAGGFGVLCTDFIDSADARARLKMATFSEETVLRMTKTSPEFASLANPVDLTAGMDDDTFIAALEAIVDDEGVDTVVCIAFFAPPSITERLIPRIAEVARRTDKPVLAFTEYGPFTDEYLKRMFDNGVIGFPSVHRTIRAARFLVERRQILERARGEER